MDRHIVVVDDETEVRRAIRLQLDGAGFEILEAEDAERGIELLRANTMTVQVVICDVRMPKISGVDAVAYFRQQYPSVPIVVLTGFPDVGLAVDFMKQGVVDYLVKPVEKDKLIAAVEKAAKMRKFYD